MKLKGTKALVTGGAVRLGRAVCEALAEEGCGVVVHFRSSAAEAGALRDALRRRGGEAWSLGADLSSEEACADLVDRAVRETGGLDILVNNAAAFHKDGLREASQEKVLAEFWPNLFAPLHLIRAFAARTRRGRIVNLLDRRIAGLDTSCVPYVLSKKALAELTRLAALALAPGITVNAVAPGAVLPPPGEGESYLRDKAGPVPLGRQVTPGDVARAVVSLIENDAVTGQVVFVDGGQHLLGDPGTGSRARETGA